MSELSVLGLFSATKKLNAGFKVLLEPREEWGIRNFGKPQKSRSSLHSEKNRQGVGWDGKNLLQNEG